MSFSVLILTVSVNSYVELAATIVNKRGWHVIIQCKTFRYTKNDAIPRCHGISRRTNLEHSSILIVAAFAIQ